MKSIQLIIGSLIFVQCGFSQAKGNNFIKVTYVDCFIETNFDISCILFDRSFQEEKKYGKIKESALPKFRTSLKNFVKVKSNGIDVRGKIEYMLHGYKYKYCFDRFGIFSNGINFYKNIQLFNLIKKTFSDFCP